MKSKMLFSIALFAAAGLVSSVQGAIFDNYSGGVSANPGDTITDSSPSSGFVYKFTAGETASLVDITAAIRAVSGNSTTIDISIWNDSDASNPGNNASTVSTRIFNQSVLLSDSADLTISNASVSFTSGNAYWISFNNASDSTGAEWKYDLAESTSRSGATSVTSPNVDGSDWAGYGDFTSTAFSISAVPEPSSIALVSGLCLVGFAAVRRARSRK